MAKKKAPAKKSTAKKSTAKKPAAKKAPVKKAAAKKPIAKKAAKKPVAKKAISTKTANPKTAKASAAVAGKVSPKALLKPLDDRIVIQIKNFEKRTAGGLYIPETADVSGNFQGTVLAVGLGHKNKKGKVRPMDVKPGDEVLFDQHAGSKLTLNGEEVRILRESEVLGIVESK